MQRIIAFFVFLIFLPLFILIVLGILIEGILNKRARGPIFYKEERMSRGEPFTLFKFRTFCPIAAQEVKENGAEQYGITAIENKKGNLTFMGRFLKKFYFDELPQLFNIMKGDMVLVGPRPLIYKLYKEQIDHGNVAKDQLTAGWTGPWQSRKGRIHTMAQIVEVENQYAQKVMKMNGLQRFMFDLGIVFKTFIIVFEGKSI